MVNAKKRVFMMIGLLFLAVMVIFIIMPFFPLLIWSVTKQWPWPLLAPEAFTFQSWTYLFSNSGRALVGLVNSVVIALLTLVITILIGLPAARVLAQKQFFGKLVVFLIFLSPLFVPFTASAMGMYKFSLELDFLNHYVKVALAHVILTFPYFLAAIWYQYRLMGIKWQEAARSLGASEWQIFRWIELPYLFPAFSLASVLVLIISLSQYLPTWIMSGGTLQTLPVIMFPYASSGDASIVSAYSLVFFLLVAGLMLCHLIIMIWARRKVEHSGKH